jgi:hypothetical protein
MTDDEILTAQELAERWKLQNTDWIYRKCREGKLPRIPLPGKYVRFRLDVIEAFERGEFQSNHNAG